MRYRCELLYGTQSPLLWSFAPQSYYEKNTKAQNMLLTLSLLKMSSSPQKELEHVKIKKKNWADLPYKQQPEDLSGIFTSHSGHHCTSNNFIIR
jgi:hypothetical protein